MFFTSSVEDAVDCALQITKALRAHPSFLLRKGIPSGPVHRVKELDGREGVAGAGINFAQRIMACGDPCHILVSKRVADDLAQMRRWQPYLHHRGDFEVKHGAVLSLVNLYHDVVGNPRPPTKLKQTTTLPGTPAPSTTTRRIPHSNVMLVGLLIAVVIWAGIFYFLRVRPESAGDSATTAVGAAEVASSAPKSTASPKRATPAATTAPTKAPQVVRVPVASSDTAEPCRLRTYYLGASDVSFTVFVNGEQIGSYASSDARAELTPYMTPGLNEIRVDWTADPKMSSHAALLIEAIRGGKSSSVIDRHVTKDTPAGNRTTKVRILDLMLLRVRGRRNGISRKRTTWVTAEWNSVSSSTANRLPATHLMTASPISHAFSMLARTRCELLGRRIQQCLRMRLLSSSPAAGDNGIAC